MEMLWLKVPQWERSSGLVHGFFGRRGGKSAGPYASLNLSFRVGDDPDAVKDNFCDVKKAVGLHDLKIVTMKQVHGDRIIDIRDRNLKEAGEADGMATDEPGIFLGVLAADCVPILFNVRQPRLAAVAHAGWRGTLAGVTAKMVRHLRESYGVEPASIEAALGPAIGSCCYEVREDVSVPLMEKWGSLAEGCLERRDGKTFLDLRELNGLLLEEAGVSPERIFSAGPCTSCAADDFFSYRREKKETGRQLSFIGWT